MAKQGKKKADVEFIAVRSPNRTSLGKPIIEPANVWAIAIFALVTIIFFWKHLSGNAFLWEDFTEFTFPNEVYAARNFMAGIIPFWNPYTFCGMPFVADLQIGFFYPGNQLMYALSGGNLSAWLAQFFVVIHYFIAMVGAWVLARGFRIGQWGSIFAGITYALSGLLVAHMIHPNMLFHLAWFPLILYFFYRGVRERSFYHALLSGIILGVALLSGHPQSALYIVFYLFCLSIYLIVADLRSGDSIRSSSVVKGLLAAALPIAVGVAIFAVQLLPSQELAGLSERAEMSYEKSLEGAMGPGQLLTLVVPKIFGVAGAETPPEMAFWYRPEIYYFWETAVYIGVAALLLGALGVVSTYLGGLRWFLAGMALLGLLYGLGDHFIVHPLLSKLPLFGTFRSPVRLAMYFSLGGALLAGVGLERCIRADEEPEKMVRVLYVVGGIIVLIGFLTVSGTLASMLDAPAQVAARVSGSGIDALLIGILSAAVAWAALRRKAPAGGAAVALIIFCVIDLSFFGMGQNTAPETGNPELTYQMYDGQFAQFKAAPPQKLFRVKMRDGGAMLMERNQGPYSGIMLFEGYNPLLLKRRVPPAATPERAYDFMNIRYGVQSNPQTGQAVMAERPNAYPHARMLYDARVGSTEQILGWLKDTTIDYTRTVLLEKAPSVRPEGSGTGTATITRYDAGEIETSVTTDKPGILVLSEVWYPAWRVTVDGNDAELLTADYSLRGVAVPAGKHTVVMRYQSDSFRTGSWISIIGSVVAISGAVVIGLGRRKKKGTEGATAADAEK